MASSSDDCQRVGLTSSSAAGAASACRSESRTTPGRGGRGAQMQPTRLNGQNLTLKTFIEMGYAKPGATAGAALDLLDQEIAGGVRREPSDCFGPKVLPMCPAVLPAWNRELE